MPYVDIEHSSVYSDAPHSLLALADEHFYKIGRYIDKRIPNRGRPNRQPSCWVITKQ